MSRENVSLGQKDGTNWRTLGSGQLLALVDLVIGVETACDHSGAEEFQEFSIRMACEYQLPYSFVLLRT